MRFVCCAAGIIAHTERMRDQSKGKTPEYTKVEDALKDKSKPRLHSARGRWVPNGVAALCAVCCADVTYNPGDLRVRFNQVDVSGKVGPVIDDDATAYTSLVVSSVPRNHDKCFPPDPSQPWLELHAQPFRQVKSKSELKRNMLVGAYFTCPALPRLQLHPLTRTRVSAPLLLCTAD
jgi:hypothetical protein